MARKTRLRRKIRRKAPAVRRMSRNTAAPALKPATGDLVIGGAMDPAEKKADAMAQAALAGATVQAAAPSPPAGALRRKCADCEKEEATPLRRKSPSTALAGGAQARTAPASAAKAVQAMGSGRALSRSERGFFEPRFGTDFSQVRVHEGTGASRASRALDAKAFAHGTDIAFDHGERTPETMAHELAHVVQQDGVARRLGRCTSKTDESTIVAAHATDGQEIFEPGDAITSSVTFGCKPLSFRSEFVDSSGTVFSSKIVRGKQLPTSGVFKRKWDGKRPFKDVGTFAEDGVYRHQLREVAYAHGKTKDKMAVSGGVLSQSPEMTVATRSKAGRRRLTKAELAATPGFLGGLQRIPMSFRQNHLVDDKGATRQDNIDRMADAMMSEVGVGSEKAQRCVGWAIRNAMTRINSYSVKTSQSEIKFATNQTRQPKHETLAKSILGKPMSDDITNGAFKWYSPQSMPPHKGKCKKDGGKANCDAGMVTLTDGSKKKSMAPDFHTSMKFVPISGVDQWVARFYKL